MHHIVSDGWSLGRPDPRGLGALRGIPPRRPLAAAGAGHPVRRLRRLAARLAPGRGAPGAARLLDQPARPLAAPGAADRSAAARGPQRPRRRAIRDHSQGPPRRGAGARAAGRGDAVHDAPGRLPGAAAPLLRPGRHRRRLADRRPRPRRAGGPHRLLRQHPGPPRRPRAATRASASCSAAPAARRSAPTRTRTSPSRSW